MQGIVALLRGITRWDEWYASKVPLLLVVFYYLSLTTPLTPAEAGGRFLRTVVFASLFLAFGYALNDLADVRADRRVGKRNVIGQFSDATGWAIVAALLLMGVAVLWPLYGQRYMLGLVTLTYVGAAAYSLRPLRLKERGWWGLLASAAAQRSFPALVIAASFQRLDWDTISIALLLLLIGLRWILVHQLLDVDRDAQAGVRTHVALRGRAVATRQIGLLSFPLELIGLATTLTVMIIRIPALAIFLLAYLVYLAGWVYVCRGLRNAFGFNGYDLQPLADFYHVWWPFSLALLLAFRDLRLLPLAGVFLLWQGRYLRSYAGMMHRVVRQGRNRASERSRVLESGVPDDA